jgi:ATP-dependent Zn protease
VNQQTSSRFATIITIVFIWAFASLMNGYNHVNIAYARHTTNQERYNFGWDQGIADCSKGQGVINSYQQTHAYLGHSDSYHQGYQKAIANCNNSGYNSNNHNSSNIGSNNGKAFQHNTPSYSNTFSSKSTTIAFLVLFLLIVAGAIAFKIRNRGKPKKRKGFPQYVKENIKRKQDNKCAHCKKYLKVCDFDHKNGNRSDNRESNCQALCPTCHAIKTRRG